MRSFKYTPKLPPYLDIAFEWREKEFVSILQSVGVIVGSCPGIARGTKSGTYSARPLLHSRNASFSCLSNCAVVIFFVHGGRRGTRSRCLFSLCLRRVVFSSSSDKRYGFCCALAAAAMILTLRRSATKVDILTLDRRNLLAAAYRQ